MNTSGLNKSGINQSQNMGSSFKTNQNLERLEKISQKLNNIHFNIENDKNAKYEEVESRLASLDEKSMESNEMTFKTFNQIKEQISNIIQNIEEDRQRFEQSYEERTQYISNLETKFNFTSIKNKIREESKIKNMHNKKKDFLKKTKKPIISRL